MSSAHASPSPRSTTPTFGRSPRPSSRGQSFSAAATPSFWPGLRRGVAAAVEHSRVPFGTNVRTVLDVGASRGQFALFRTRALPGRTTWCVLSRCPRRATNSRACWASESRSTASRSAIEPGRPRSRFLPETTPLHFCQSGNASSTYFRAHRACARFVCLLSRCRPICRTICHAHAYFKIDVQGFELQVLRGTGEGLRVVDEIFVECSFVELYDGQALADDVVCFLREAGFRLVGVHGLAVAADGSSLQADFLFRRS